MPHRGHALIVGHVPPNRCDTGALRRISSLASMELHPEFPQLLSPWKLLHRPRQCLQKRNSLPVAFVQRKHRSWWSFGSVGEHQVKHPGQVRDIVSFPTTLVTIVFSVLCSSSAV